MAIFKINSRFSKIDSCALTIEDFKSLFKLLNDKVNEAYKHEADEPKTFENVPKEEVEKFKERIKQNFRLGVLVIGTKGENLAGDDDSIFDDENFPNNISEITFDSSYYFKYMTGREPMNKLIVQLDFKKQNIFDFSNPITAPMRNESSITVRGMNDTWVNGVYSKIIDFFKGKKKNRNWLHKKYIYDLFLYLLLWPATFWCIYRVSSLLQGKINIIPLIAICLYVSILLFYILRILFNYTGWIFPLVEFTTKSGTKMNKHKAVLSVLLIVFFGIISNLIADIIKSIF